LSTPTIAEFLFDDVNEEKIARHGLSIRRVRQVLDNVHVIAPNRRARRGMYLVIGRDHGGAAITVPVEPTHDPKLWRPITAWPSKAHEAAKLPRRDVPRRKPQ
jgi:uncharacterized DUF497 family protein